MDRSFFEWTDGELWWFPTKGMGYLSPGDDPVEYGETYWQEYLKRSRDALDGPLNDARFDLVERFVGRGTLVCDVGIGVGRFIERRGMATVGYDVNPYGVDWLEERELFHDPYEEPVPAMTFWDVLEHIETPTAILRNAQEWVFVSMPIVPGDGPPPTDWKHLKRGEHLWYWTRDGLIRWMDETQGFRCVWHGTPEMLLGREDVETFVFRRK